MNPLSKLRFAFLVFLPALTLSGCQLSKSGGRSLFESNAPAGITNTNLSSQSIASRQASSCWTQPVTEPLWDMETGQTYSVTLQQDSIIEVCRDESISGQGQ